MAYLAVVPELVVEVRSPSDRPAMVLGKVAEYLEAGVAIVCVVDPKTRTVTVYDDAPPRVLDNKDVLALPELLPGFELPIAKLFE